MTMMMIELDVDVAAAAERVVAVVITGRSASTDSSLTASPASAAATDELSRPGCPAKPRPVSRRRRGAIFTNVLSS